MDLSCPHHPKEPLNLLCCSQKCSKRGLLCCLCKDQFHQSHIPLMPLKHFIYVFLERSSFEQNSIGKLAQIDHQMLLINRLLQKSKRQFQNPKVIEEEVSKFQNNTRKEISSFQNTIEELRQIYHRTDQKTLEDLNIWIQKHYHLYQFDKKIQEKYNVCDYFLQRYLENLKNMHSVIQNNLKKSQFHDSQILQFFQTQTVTSLHLHFSKDFIPSNMQLLDDKKIILKQAGSQRLALLNPPLSSTHSIKKWKIKIVDHVSWIGVGVSYATSVLQSNFAFHYTSAGHGNYLLSSNGYTWTGYKFEHNSKHQSFHFKTGDIIELSYDPAHNKMTVKKDDLDEVHTIEIDPQQKPIHAVVNLTGVGDCVEIIK